jgi:hypothetical protein
LASGTLAEPARRTEIPSRSILFIEDLVEIDNNMPGFRKRVAPGRLIGGDLGLEARSGEYSQLSV